MAADPSRLGQVKVEGQRASITFERRLDYPPEEVWEAITDPEELSKWYMSEVRIERKLGGTVYFSSGGRHVTGSILVWDPPHVFEHEWRADLPGFEKAEYDVVRWELKREGGGTHLTLIHRNMPSQIARLAAPGVHAALDRLEAYLDGAPLPDFMKRVEELRRSYTP